MEMRIVLPVRGPHGRDLLPARDPLAPADQHRVEVAVKGVDIAHVAVLAISVPDNDHISPAQMNVAGKDHDAVADTVDRVAQIGITAAHSVPIFTYVATGPEPAGFVIAFRFRFADGEIETVSDLREAGIERSSRNNLGRLFLRRN